MKEMQIHKAKVDHSLTPDDIRCIRKKLHFSQKQAAEYFGGGVNGFSRYERGESPPPRALSSLFTILDKDPQQIELLTKSQ